MKEGRNEEEKKEGREEGNKEGRKIERKRRSMILRQKSRRQ